MRMIMRMMIIIMLIRIVITIIMTRWPMCEAFPPLAQIVFGNVGSKQERDSHWPSMILDVNVNVKCGMWISHSTFYIVNAWSWKWCEHAGDSPVNRDWHCLHIIYSHTISYILNHMYISIYLSYLCVGFPVRVDGHTQNRVSWIIPHILVESYLTS